MRILMISALFSLLLASCGQDLTSRRTSFEGADTNDFVVQSCSETGGPLCAQPPMPVCPEGMVCAQVMPNPKTYLNDCEMKKEGAQFIQNGNCPSTSL